MQFASMHLKNDQLAEDCKALQLVSKTPEQFKDLSSNKVRLKQAGIDHGAMASAASSLAGDGPSQSCAYVHPSLATADIHALPL